MWWLQVCFIILFLTKGPGSEVLDVKRVFFKNC